jgi:aminopeptidase
MIDSRIEKLAYNLINYSCKLGVGENVLIDSIGGETQLTKALIKEAYKAGGIPFVNNETPETLRVLLTEATKEQLEKMAQYESKRMNDMDAYIGLRASLNSSEMGDIPAEKMKAYMEYYVKPVHYEIRVNKTKWVVLRYPNHSMAQAAGMSTDRFEELYFNVCNLDYEKMSVEMNNLVDLMNATNKVRITGKDTDLSFSIKDLPGIKCDGHRNIPDGEVYSAPVKESVNGKISYNVPSIYQGVTFENIVLEFKDGKIVDAKANDTERINKIFDTDEGARFVGEFSIGLNPYIENPMKDILFDEKIKGSIHFTPGNCYDECNNGNKSSVHWDLVLIQRPEYGGGEIYFDNVLIRKDGIFVLDSLIGLNPEALK